MACVCVWHVYGMRIVLWYDRMAGCVYLLGAPGTVDDTVPVQLEGKEEERSGGSRRTREGGSFREGEGGKGREGEGGKDG